MTVSSVITHSPSAVYRGSSAFAVWTLAVLAGAAIDAVFGAGPRPELMMFLVGGGVPLLAHALGRSFATDEVMRISVMLVWGSVAVAACLLAGEAGSAFAALFVTPAAAAAACGPRRAVPEGLFVGTAGLAAVAALFVSDVAPTAGGDWTMGLLPWAGAFAAMAFAAAAVGAAVRREEATARGAQARLTRAQAVVERVGAGTARVHASGRIIEGVGAVGGSLAFGDAGAFECAFEDAFDEIDRPKLRRALKHAINDGETCDVRATAGDSPVALQIAPFRPGEALVFVRDATEEVVRISRAEEERDAAREAQERTSQYFAGMSHELRTPLNAILGFSETMKEEALGPMPERYAEYAALIHESGRHLLDLVGDLLDLTKAEAGRYQLNLTSFDAREAVDTAVRMTAERATAEGLNLLVEIDDAPLNVHADARALRQVLLNLVSNAIKFTPPGGDVHVRARAEGRDLVLEVADTGPGMTHEELERLGKPYEQGTLGRKSQQRGTGLGLALVSILAELHGGRFEPTSVLGQGSVMRIRVPVLQAGERPDDGVVIAATSRSRFG